MRCQSSPSASMPLGPRPSILDLEGTGTTSTGSFVSVMKVREVRSQKIFAAKLPHFILVSSDPASKVRKRWESLTEEFRKTVKLQNEGDHTRLLRRH